MYFPTCTKQQSLETDFYLYSLSLEQVTAVVKFFILKSNCKFSIASIVLCLTLFSVTDKNKLFDNNNFRSIFLYFATVIEISCDCVAGSAEALSSCLL